MSQFQASQRQNGGCESAQRALTSNSLSANLHLCPTDRGNPPMALLFDL